MKRIILVYVVLLPFLAGGCQTSSPILTQLHRAAAEGDAAGVKALLDRDADVNGANINGDTPLLLATWKGSKETVRLLIDLGAEVNVADNNRWTPLMVAASQQGSKEIVQLLLDRGADVNVANINGDTPLMVAVGNGNKETALLLLDHGAEPGQTNDQGQSAAAAAPPAPDVEMASWSKVKDSRDFQDYQNFLQAFPDGIFAEIAKGRLNNLTMAAARTEELTSQAAKETRIALVIGNGNYKTSSLPPLANPPNDARLMTRTLRSLGFQVIERLDQDQNGIRRSIRDFGKALDRAGDDAVALFYYAGHGVQVRGNNYLLPVNAAIELESDVSIEAINANTVLDTLSFTRSRLNFVIVDACRNNPLARSFRSASRGLARMDAPSGTLIGYATAPGDVAADGSGANSPYTEALATAMGVAGLSVEQMFRRVRNMVMAKTKDRQVPWESSSLTGGDFYFKPLAQAKPPPVQATTGSSVEMLFWQSIQNSDDPSDFEAYLTQYPNGPFSALARNRLNRIKQR